MNALTDMPRFGEAVESYYGVYAGVVVDNDDPEQRARVKVRLPWISADYTTEWMPVAQIYAGAGYGAYWIPEVDDQVLVQFLRGQLRQPVVTGSLYSQAAAPHAARGGGSDPKYFRTAGGHMLMMEDGTGRKIELIDATGNNSVVIDSEANSITVTATADVTIEATASLTLKGADITIEATGSVTVTGATINLN